MQIRTIRVKEIVMTRDEHEKFIRLMQKAADGHTSHSASEALEDGSVLQVTIDDTLDRDLAERAMRKRDGRAKQAEADRRNGYKPVYPQAIDD